MINLCNDANAFIEYPLDRSNIFYPKTDIPPIISFIQSGVSYYKIPLRTNIEYKMDSENIFNLSDDSSALSVPSLKSSTSAGSLKMKVKNKNIFVDLNGSIINSQLDTEIEISNQNPKIRKRLIADIEAFIIKILQDITTGKDIKIQIPSFRTWDNIVIQDGILTTKELANVAFSTTSFKYLGCRHHLALILYILSEVYHLLITNTTCTERELYYDNLEISENQLNIKSAIRDVCKILKTSPWDLGIRSSAKGLFAGAIRVHTLNRAIIDCNVYDGASLIPDVQNIRFIETSAKLVLIIEKDTIFENLLKHNILLEMHYDIILITGKGYPDINTRLFIKRLYADFRLPIYALVDADPFGIEIMLVYRFGSKTMVFNSDQLACPEIRWIGIHPSEIDNLAIPSVSLSKYDDKKILELLERSYIDGQIRNELEFLKKTNCKAEIESLARFSIHFLVCEYIPNKIKRNLVL